MEKQRMTICVDASCVNGNPGNAKYRGMDLSTGEILFHYDIPGISNSNLAEYFAIIHAIKYTLQNNLRVTIYSDSVVAIRWVVNHYVNTNLKKNKDTEISHKLIKNSLKITKLIERRVLKKMVQKWDTFSFGENPADFNLKSNYKSNHQILTTTHGK